MGLEAAWDDLDLTDGDSRVPVSVQAALWRLIAKGIPDPAFAVRAGASMKVREAGLLGYVMSYSATLGDALRRLVRSSHISPRVAAPGSQRRRHRRRCARTPECAGWSLKEMSRASPLRRRAAMVDGGSRMGSSTYHPLAIPSGEKVGRTPAGIGMNGVVLAPTGAGPVSLDSWLTRGFAGNCPRPFLASTDRVPIDAIAPHAVARC